MRPEGSANRTDGQLSSEVSRIASPSCRGGTAWALDRRAPPACDLASLSRAGPLSRTTAVGRNPKRSQQASLTAVQTLAPRTEPLPPVPATGSGRLEDAWTGSARLAFLLEGRVARGGIFQRRSRFCSCFAPRARGRQPNQPRLVGGSPPGRSWWVRWSASSDLEPDKTCSAHTRWACRGSRATEHVRYSRASAEASRSPIPLYSPSAIRGCALPRGLVRRWRREMIRNALGCYPLYAATLPVG